MLIHLSEYLPSTREGWGRQQGQSVQEALHRRIEAESAEHILTISLDQVRRTDVPFARVSVVELAVRYRGQRGFCLTDVDDPDILANWEAAAFSRKQPLTLMHQNGQLRIIGVEPGVGLQAMLSYALSAPVVLAHEAACLLGISISNASTKLARLWQEGYLLRQERPRPSGGIEYGYARIAPPGPLAPSS